MSEDPSLPPSNYHIADGPEEATEAVRERVSGRPDSLFGSGRTTYDELRRREQTQYNPGVSTGRSEQVKCHYKRRNGWIMTKTETGVCLEPIGYRHLAETREMTNPSFRAMPITEEVIQQLTFRLVKVAEIRDYKNNTTRTEAWFEEV